MLNNKSILPKVLILLVLLGLYAPLEPSLQKDIKEIPEDISELFPRIDLNDRKAVEEEIRKINQYKLIEGETIRHLVTDELEDEEKSESLRSLATDNLFDDVVIVDPATEPYSSIGRWFTRSAKQYSSSIVLYPYQFSYNHKLENGTTINKKYEQGGFISINPDDLNGLNLGLKTQDTLKTKKARALYDADIAIININTNYEYLNNFNLFDEAIDWCTYFQTYLGKGTCLGNYQEFLRHKTSSPLSTFVTWINETEINAGRLINEDQLPRFGILIIPDYYLGAESLIKSKLTGARLVDYYNKGGIIFVTGKSGVLFQDFGLIAKGTYNPSTLVTVDKNDRKISSVGCEETHVPYNKDLDFKKQLLCASINKERKITVASTFLINNLDPDFENLIYIDTTDENLKTKNKDSGVLSNLTEAQKVNFTLVAHKRNEKNGQIFLLNFNPVFAGGDKNILLNLVALCFSKELYFTSKVTMTINDKERPDLPIPAGETGFNLEVNSILHNLNDAQIFNSTLYVFLPDNFNWTEIPNKCSLKTDFVNITKNITAKRTFKTNTNPYLLCDLGTIESYEKYSFKITISVLNYKATQQKYNVLILNPILVFTDSNLMDNIFVDNVRVNAEAAPLLRVAINPDPSSFYPVKGEGQYVDNVVKIENKEQTGALDVESVGLIPVVSPLTDGDDQRVTQWNLKLYVDYYNGDNKFEVPFTADDAQDFIYISFLQGKGTVIVAEWDSPVLPVKEIITEEKLGNMQLGKEEVDLKGINVGMITINRTSEIIKQINYRKSDRFYKLASQRLMVFIDDSNPIGATTLYGSYDKIPDEWKDPILKDRAKREFIFTRSDIYFYNNENYVNPPKITENVIFSLDKYVPYQKNKNGCVNGRSIDATSKILTPGYFDNFDQAHRAKILEPRIYSNELFEYCDLTVIDPTNVNEIKAFFGDTNHIRPVHYIIPNVASSITRPSQIYKFKEVNAHSGYHEVYNSIKFIYVHTLDFIVNKDVCLYGGKIEIDLGSYTVKSADDITIAPDQIAVYKLTLENKKISALFRRGLNSNEQFGKDLKLTVNIENLSVEKDVNLTLSLYEMKFDISFEPTYERYYPISSEPKEFKYISAWSYPALEIKATLNRTFNGYETIEPFSRYGVYIQELNHRTVYGTAETHFQSKPGIVGNGAGFSMISNLGISSIPFIEYVTVGKGQVIPAASGTSRASWKDIWGRTWHQPLRSVFPDVPPIPPPLKNFMMSTTYELLQDGKQIYEWPSDENALIHIHIKLLNNYQKYFEITRCEKNQILFIPKTLGEYHHRVYEAKSSLNIENYDNKDNLYLREGGYASYGTCFTEKGAIVGGQKVEGQLKDQIERAKVCADYTNAQEIKKCEEELKDITTLHKVDASSSVKGKKWNYSPTVESYYPKGYISDDMWDLTHIDYDNNNMDKAYKYHMDNLLPNYDNTIIKPHNTLSIPIYKGLGYSILYNKNIEIDYHGTKKKGWWCDNLQNKDDTLVAGQNTCNEISVNKDSSISKWVEGKDLRSNVGTGDASVKNIINNRNRNIYVCLYNRNRPDFGPDKNKKYYTGNVNQNNIVPIIVDLEKDDPRLSSYQCTGNQYTPDNIHELDGNLLETPTSKDYLYFAANLRGQAKESFNILMNLTHFSQIRYEGMVKVNEGGRFVYWNPANGPNSFLVVDDPVSIVNAKRNDIDISNNLFPGRVPTFNAIVYHSYTFRDSGKIKKVWPFNEYYANSYGFGDVAISVYIGGIRKSKAVIQPGETTYAKIIFFNNCGFDWNMKGDAIDFEYRDSKPISANDLLSKAVHTIQAPKEYRFLKCIIPDDYKNYIQIRPSDHNIEVAPEFFDFENINVVSIRDGFKGEYYLQINVTNDIPDELRGKPIEIKLEVLSKYFDKFPGTKSDPIKSFHKYNVQVPSLYIAVPFRSGPYQGKVLYTSAQASDLDLSITLGLDWEVDAIKYVTPDILTKMSQVVVNTNSLTEFEKYWNQLGNKTIKYKEEVVDYNNKKLSLVGIKDDYPYFPKIVRGSEDIAEVSVLIKSFVGQIPFGQTYPIENVKMKYKQWNGKKKESEGSRPFIYGNGAWIVLSYSRTLVDQLPDGTYVEKENQDLYHEDDGIMRVDFKISNIGNGDSFSTIYSIIIEKDLTYVGHDLGLKEVSIKKQKGGTNVTFELNAGILKGENFGSYIYLRYYKCIDSYGDLTSDELLELPKSLKVAKEAEAIIDLTKFKGENTVTEHIRTPLVFDYKLKTGSLIYMDLILTGRRRNPNIKIKPKIVYKEKDNKNNVKISIGKLDYTKYKHNISNSASIMRQLAESLGDILYTGNVSNYKDKPNNRETSRKDHYIKYKIRLQRSDRSFILSELAYDQKKIGLSLNEKIVIIGSSAFIFLAILFIILGCANLKKAKKRKNLEDEVNNNNIEPFLEDE